jgi:hypothetical protein
LEWAPCGDSQRVTVKKLFVEFLFKKLKLTTQDLVKVPIARELQINIIPKVHSKRVTAKECRQRIYTVDRWFSVENSLQHYNAM